jgi:O-antigen/teichoic acid export membrane protein
MGIVVRQSIKSSIGYYLGVGLGAVNTLYFSTKFLETDQLATSRLLLENGLVFAAFAHLGTPSICDRYLAKYKDRENQHHGFLLFLLLIGLFGFLIFTILFWVFYDKLETFYGVKSPSISQNLILCVPITFIWMYILIFETYIRGHQRIAVPTFLRETIFRFLNIILIILVGLKIINFSQFLILFVGIMFLIVLALVIYTWKLGYLYLSPKYLKLSEQQLKEMLGYGLFLILGSIGTNLIYFLDRNILASEIGTTAASIFIVATYFASVIEMPGKSIKQISSPLLAQSILHQWHDKTCELYNKVANNTMLVGGILLIFIFINLESLLSIMPKANLYQQGFWVIIILGICKWIDTSLGLSGDMISYSKYYKFNTYIVLILAVLAVFLNYLLIGIFGIIGSAMATGIITLLSTTTRLLIVKSKFQIHPFTINTAKAMVILIICLTIGLLIPNFASSVFGKLVVISIKSLLIGTLFLFLVLRFNVSEDFVNLQNVIITKAKQKFNF